MTDRSRRDFIRQTSVAAVATGFFTHTAFGADDSVTADTSLGKIRGVDDGGIKTFKGIPYGANTAGPNRFLPPKPAPKWAGVKDARKYGYSCPQNEPGKPVKTSDVAVAGAGLTAENEDCLALNVWTPTVNDGRKRPVMFWCHGGGFSSGSGSSPITAGRNLAKRGDVVVVALNHRLNVLGYCNLAAIAGPDFADSGDVGMMDVVLALNWVKDNIAQFGGDPGNVTIFGQSGGGMKVSTLLAMPSAKGLFHRAIIESGASLKGVDQETGTKAAGLLLTKLGIDKAKARDIQTVPINTLMTAYFAVTRDLQAGGTGQVFAPASGGKVLPHDPFTPTASPISADVPVMIGSTRTEWSTFSDDASFSLDEAGMQDRIQKLLGADAGNTIAAYQKNNPGASPPELYFLILSDRRIGADTYKLAERRAALGKGLVYLYYFTWKSPMDGGKFISPHTVEIPFAFDTLKSANLTKDAPDAPALMEKVSAAWIAFARTGNPNVPTLPHWPQFDAKTWPTMVFNNDSKVVNDPIHGQRLAIWNAMKL
jgi:para-nitrobenzyl esterase